MKKVWALVILTFIIFTSYKDRNNFTFIPDTKNDAYIDSETNEISNEFICKRNFIEVDDWIYYYCSDRSLRKCRPDLSDDTLLAKDVNNFYIQDSSLYFIKRPKDNECVIYKADLDANEFKAKIITDINQGYNPIVFQDSVFYESSDQLRVYNIKEDTEDIIVGEMFNDFSIVDNYIYYNLSYDNCIYRYNIDTKVTEEFFSFEAISFTPKVYYFDRTILIQTYTNSFVYVNIDDLTMKNIVFDTSEYEQGWAMFYCIDIDNLYFSLAESYNVANPLTVPHSIFKVKLGTEKAEFVKIVFGDNMKFINNNVMYTFDDNEKICKEEL